MLRLQHLAKAFGRKPALHDFSLEVPTGVIFGLLGHNGAGKSTTLGIILGQVLPDRGEAFIGGISVQRNRARALAQTGAVFEAPRFYDYLSGWRNLCIYTSYSERIPKRKLMEAVELVGLEERIHDRVGTYSQGMRQRLGLAQALLPDNQLLLLDEPTNGLDPEGIHEMRLLIQRLNQERGLTVIFCSHLLSEVEQLCSHVAVLHAGRKIFDGPWSQLKPEQKQLRLEVEDWPNTATLLRKFPEIRIDGAGLITVPPTTEIPDLIAHLVQSGVRLHSIEPLRLNLEQIYLDLTQAASAPASR